MATPELPYLNIDRTLSPVENIHRFEARIRPPSFGRIGDETYVLPTTHIVNVHSNESFIESAQRIDDAPQPFMLFLKDGGKLELSMANVVGQRAIHRNVQVCKLWRPDQSGEMIEYPAVFNNAEPLGRLYLVDPQDEYAGRLADFPQAFISIKPEDIDISRYQVNDIAALTTLAHFGVDIHSRSLEIDNPHIPEGTRLGLDNIEHMISYVAEKMGIQESLDNTTSQQIFAWLWGVSFGSILSTKSNSFSPTPTAILMDDYEVDTALPQFQRETVISLFESIGLLFEVEFGGQQYYVSDPVINLAFDNIPTSN